MSERTLAVDIVTPERRIWRGRARMLVAKGSEGELGVLPGHIPLVTPLVDGEVRLHGAVRAEGDDGEDGTSFDAAPAEGGREAGAPAAARGAGESTARPGDLVFRCQGGFLVVDGEGARVLADRAEVARSA